MHPQDIAMSNPYLGAAAAADSITAAAALLDCAEAGIIAAAPMMPSFQQFEIARELRVDGQILHGPGAADCCVVALTALACIRRGLETGALVVTRADALPHIRATFAQVADELDAAEQRDGPLATLWFDAPVVLPAG